MRKGKPFNLENNVDTLLYQLQINFEKVREFDFFDRQNDNKATTKMLGVGQFLCKNIDFRAQLSNFRVENTSRSRFFLSKILYHNSY